jgi:hypothetical protein
MNEETTNKKISNKEYDIENQHAYPYPCKIYEVERFFTDPHNPRVIKEYMNSSEKNYSQCRSLDALVEDTKTVLYNNSLQFLFPGVSTELDLDTEKDRIVYNIILDTIEEKLARKISHLSVAYNVAPSRSMHGCVNVDAVDKDVDPNLYSGVIYMSTDVIPNSGTTIYQYQNLSELLESFNFSIQDYVDLVHIIYDTNISPDNFVKKKCSEEVRRIMSSLRTYKIIDNKFNKFVAYPMYMLHSAENYYGDHMLNSRESFKVYFKFKD